jgi:glucoamylase
MTEAPGRPGIPPRWTSSAKSGVGTAMSPLSRIWFTLSHGILNEVYYPRVDQACIRDFGLIVTDGVGFFAEEKRDTVSHVSAIEDGVPAYTLVNEHTEGRFRIHKQIVSDPRLEVLLQRVRLETLSGPPLRLFGLLAPHLVNGGARNNARLGEYKGEKMLFADGGGTNLALAASRGFAARSVGFVGVSDGWHQLNKQFYLATQYDTAMNGNVALCVEITAPEEPCCIAVGFGRTDSEAAFRVRAGLQEDFDVLIEEYCADWRAWQTVLRPLDRMRNGHNTYRVSTSVIRTHETPSFPGGLIASLSIPWGFSKGDDDLGGYHLVWPRDLAQSAGGLLAAGAPHAAMRVLEYLRAVQEPDGHWHQNNWLDGMPYWGALQLDETGFPILLTDLAWRSRALTMTQLGMFWPMLRAAAGFLLRNGPITAQDRWEENGGYSPNTLAVEVAALLAAADFAELHEEPALAELLRETADFWNASIEDWTFVRGSALAARFDVPGYYVRIAPPLDGSSVADLAGRLSVRNVASDVSDVPVADVVSQDFTALVRFGLREANDQRIVDTLKVVDALLRTDLPQGPVWHRYCHDGYGEHADGAPFNGTGIGRAWPLLTGERAHLELAAGRRSEAERLLETLEASSGDGFMLPEQVWDEDDLPQHELFRGRPSGSAMPLVWAHAEHVKLLRSLSDGAVFDTPPQTVRRYLRANTPARCHVWRPDWRAPSMPAGRCLRVDLPQAATVRWSADGWATANETATTDCGIGLYCAELSVAAVPAGGEVVFTWRNADGAWLGFNHSVAVTSGKTA